MVLFEVFQSETMGFLKLQNKNTKTFLFLLIKLFTETTKIFFRKSIASESKNIFKWDFYKKFDEKTKEFLFDKKTLYFAIDKTNL